MVEGIIDISSPEHMQVSHRCRIMINYDVYILIPTLFRNIIRFCFGSLIQSQLNQFVDEWNHHRIRPSKKADASGGIPDVM